MVEQFLSMLISYLKRHLRGTNPTQVAILAFAVSMVVGGALVALALGVSVWTFVGVIVPSAALTLRLHQFVENLNNDPVDNGNQQFHQLANMLAELENDLTDYKRVTRVLESREMKLDTVLEHTSGSRGIWIAFGDQILDSSDEQAIDDEVPKGNWVRYVLEQYYDLVMVSPQTWLIPPAVVEREGLGTADSDQLEQWMKENVFSKFPNSTVTIPIMNVVDLGRGYIKPGVEGAHLNTLPLAIVEDADTFTEEDLFEALREQKLNLLEVVKSGEIVFFLPLDLTNTKTDAIRENEERVIQYLDDHSLRGLANENNVDGLARGLNEVDEVNDPEGLAQDINQEAQRWSRVLNQV